MELLVATRSAGKMAEIRRLLSGVPGLRLTDLDELGLPPDRTEDELEAFSTFEENALAKAEHFFRRAGVPTVADDSGLEVDALGGAPGVRSKRFAPERALEGAALDHANSRHLVAKLADVDPDARTARYVCVAVLVDGDNPPLRFRGEAEGRIVLEPRGRGGFGYDPHVLDPGLGRTFAEMSPGEKDRHSHRGKAFRALATKLRKTLGAPPILGALPILGVLSILGALPTLSALP